MGGVKARAKTAEQKSFLMPTLREQLDARQPLYRLAQRIPWEFFEKEFGEFYSEEGRPAKPVRLMAGLLLLKQMFNLGDEIQRRFLPPVQLTRGEIFCSVPGVSGVSPDYFIKVHLLATG